MLRPFASFRESLLVRGCEWFVVDGGVRNCAGDGVEQALEHADGGGHLVRGKVLDQFVGVLFVCRHNKAILHRDVWPPYSFAVALVPCFSPPCCEKWDRLLFKNTGNRDHEGRILWTWL